MNNADRGLELLATVLNAKGTSDIAALEAALQSWNQQYKDTLCFKVYFEKPTNANPYYVRNDGLLHATELVEELLALRLPGGDSAAAATALSELGGRLGLDARELPQAFAQAGLGGLFAAVADCNPEIESFYGGTRSTIPHDCQITLRLALYPDMDKAASEQIVRELVAKHGGKLEVNDQAQFPKKGMVINMGLDRYDIPREKVTQIEVILQQQGIDALLILAREYSDGNLPFIVGDDAIHTGAAFIRPNGKHIMITSVSDSGKFEESGIFSEVITYDVSIKETLACEYKKLGINKLALNYSEDENLCDGLTQGLYLLLQEVVGEQELARVEMSSEEILKEIRSQKSDTEIAYMRESVRITQSIYKEVFAAMRCGMSEIEIGDLFVQEMKRHNVVNGIGESYDYPIICLVRAGLAHRNPGHTKSIPGDILICDFSVRYKGYVSDIARTAYFLKPGESCAPKDIQHAFDTAHEAITQAIAAIGTGKRGYEVDAVGRGVVEAGGYPTVRHSVGHQIGLECHETGTRLATRRPQSENLLRTREIYAVEPTVIQDDGLPCMLVEENVVVRDNGAELLSVRQDALILIPAN